MIEAQSYTSSEVSMYAPDFSDVESPPWAAFHLRHKALSLFESSPLAGELDSDGY